MVGTISVSTQTDQEVTHSLCLAGRLLVHSICIHTSYLWSSWDTSSKITSIHPHVHHPMLTVAMKDVAPRDINKTPHSIFFRTEPENDLDSKFGMNLLFQGEKKIASEPCQTSGVYPKQSGISSPLSDPFTPHPSPPENHRDRRDPWPSDRGVSKDGLYNGNRL